MTTYQQLLSLFESNRGVYISGEEIAEKLNISRTAVWKVVSRLKKDGYNITGIKNKGYCLSENSDILSFEGINKFLKKKDFYTFDLLKTVPSTNSYVLSKAYQGKKEGYTVISHEQTLGRGRNGRKFFSPDESGIYMSILLRPTDLYQGDTSKITAIAGVAMSEAIEQLSGKKTDIKWINDLFIDGKKVCGILTDASVELESGKISFAVVGLGVNIYKPFAGFPDDIKDIAGYIFDEKQGEIKNKLIALFLNNFYKYYKNLHDKSYLSGYRQRNFIIGKKVKILCDGKISQVLVKGIDDGCKLVVTDENGKNQTFSCGDISVKL